MMNVAIAAKEYITVEKIKHDLQVPCELKLFRQSYETEPTYSLFGKKYYLSIEQSEIEEVRVDGDKICIRMPRVTYNHRKIRKMLTQFYREQASLYMTEKTLIFASIIKVNPRSILVKSLRLRCGSCSINKDIVYNWATMMAPQPVIDYVIAHQVCHLIYNKHCKNFWSLMETLLPGYEKAKLWLQRYRQNLTL